MLDNQDNYNVAAMHKALVTIRKRLVAAYASESEFMQLSNDKPLVDLIDAALSKPPRQCDVGTAEEQLKRHGEWCAMRPTTTHPCLDRGWCHKCFAKWAQTPYEAERRGEGK